MLKLPARDSTPTLLPFSGLNKPNGVAVDATGNVYIADRDNKRVLNFRCIAQPQ